MRGYTCTMPARLVRTFDEIAELMRTAPPPTADDVTILADGRRLDTPEKVRAWVHEMNAERAREAEDAGAKDEPAA